jgi:hypothetical protein
MGALSNGVDLTAIPLFFFIIIIICSTTPWTVKDVRLSSVCLEVRYPQGQGRQCRSLEPGGAGGRKRAAQQANGEETLHPFLQHFGVAPSLAQIRDKGRFGRELPLLLLSGGAHPQE